MDPSEINKDEMKSRLSEEEYNVLFEKGTEAPYSGKYRDHSEEGIYACKCCGTELFSSDTKSTSHILGLAGWPGFDEAIPGRVDFKKDDSHGMNRTEVVCSTCGCHLGHVFDVGEQEKTGKHFCINSCALDFNGESKEEKKPESN